MTTRAAPRTDLCPRCGGCLPGEGPACDVCACGSRWADDLMELIRLLDELLSDPPPPDSCPVPEEPAPPAPVLSDTTEEEITDHG